MIRPMSGAGEPTGEGGEEGTWRGTEKKKNKFTSTMNSKREPGG